MKVSIIIPVYNAEKWIKKCLDSVRSQTYTNIEIIVVDDGCRDNTLEIVEDHIRLDPRVRLIRKEHTGLHLTRKRGISEAIGETIFQCDQDDFLEPRGIELLVAKMKETNADLVIGNHYKIMKEKRRLVTHKLPEKEGKIELLRSLLNNEIMGYPWGKLFKRELLLDLDLSLTVAYLEDVMTSIHVLARHEVKVALEETPVYNYIIHRESTSSTKNQALIETIPRCVWVVEKILEKENLVPELEKEFSAFKCRNWIVYARLGGVLAKDKVSREYFFRNSFGAFARKNLAFYQNLEMFVYRYNFNMGVLLTRAMKKLHYYLY